MKTIKMIEALCVINWYTIEAKKIRVKWFQTNSVRVERQCGFALVNRWISASSGPRSAGAAQCAQIKLDHKGLHIHQGPRYCQQICPILFAFDSKFRSCVLGITDFVAVNSAQMRNKRNWVNRLKVMNETAVENHSMTWFILFHISCQQAKGKFTFTLPWPQKLVNVTYHLFCTFSYMVIRPKFSLSRIVYVSHWCIMHEIGFIRDVSVLLSQCTVQGKSTARKRKKGQVTEVHLDILGQRSLRAKPNYKQQ